MTQASLTEYETEETPDLEVYDPNPDYKKKGGFGTARRTTLEALDRKDRLGTADEEDINDITDVLQAVYAVHLDYRHAPRTEVISQIWSVYSGLRDDAKPEYVTDDVLIKRINSLRRYWDKTYTGRLRRWSEMPGTAEAGPSNYPVKKHRKRRDSYRKASEELDERFSKVKSAARGARQRALNAIGSSVAEENKKERKSLEERRRENWEPGDLVTFFSGSTYVGEIVRVNKRSARVRYTVYGDAPEDGEYKKNTVKLESDNMIKRIGDDASMLSRARNADISKDEVTDLEALRKEVGLPTREESEVCERGKEA